MDSVVFDWRETKKNGYYILSEISEQQGHTCLEHGLVATIEARYRLLRANGNEGGEKLSIPHAIDTFKRRPKTKNAIIDGFAMAKEVGIAKVQDYDATSHKLRRGAKTIKLYGYERLDVNDHRKIIQELKENGPLIAKIHAYSQLLNDKEIYRNKGRVIRNATTSQIRSHCIVLIGVNEPEDYYWYQGSYGTQYAWDGFGKIHPSAIRAVYAPRLINS